MSAQTLLTGPVLDLAGIEIAHGWAARRMKEHPAGEQTWKERQHAKKTVFEGLKLYPPPAHNTHVDEKKSFRGKFEKYDLNLFRRNPEKDCKLAF